MGGGGGLSRPEFNMCNSAQCKLKKIRGGGGPVYVYSHQYAIMHMRAYVPACCKKMFCCFYASFVNGDGVY